MKRMRPNIPCIHCNTSLGLRKRGLCNACYVDKAIRGQYPLECKISEWDHEPTMAELDALIEERSRNLPSWWYRGGTEPKPVETVKSLQRRRRKASGKAPISLAR